MNQKSEKPCGCGKPASEGRIKQALDLYNNRPRTRGAVPQLSEPYPPPEDDQGEPDETVMCLDNPEVRQIAVWATYYLDWCDYEESAMETDSLKTTKDSSGAAYLTCRFNA